MATVAVPTVSPSCSFQGAKVPARHRPLVSCSASRRQAMAGLAAGSVALVASGVVEGGVVSPLPASAVTTPLDLSATTTSASSPPGLAAAGVGAQGSGSSSGSSSGSNGSGKPKGKLASRFDSPETLVSPGVPLFSRPQILEYPRWLFGEWRMTSTFRQFAAPLGRSGGYVDAALLTAADAPLEQGGLGSVVEFTMRWYSTLPDSLNNKLRVSLGLVPESAVVQDRAFNLRSSTNAYLGFDGIASVTYDPREEPDRATAVFATDVNGRRLPPRRLELYINYTSSEYAGLDDSPAAGSSGPDGSSPSPAAAPPVFYTSELLRQVQVAVGDVSVQDYEVLTRYELTGPDSVRARQVSAIYLDPRHPKYFQAANRAVAVYVFDWHMARVTVPDGGGGRAACVQSPKDVVQCI